MGVKQKVTEVPLLDLNAQYDGIKGEIKQAIDKVLESQYFIMGPEVESFEDEIAAYCGAEYAVGCASGSDALLLALMSKDIGPGDAVITTSFTFFATGGAIARLGATPVFLDINPKTYNLDPGQVESFLENSHPLNDKLGVQGESVKAIIPVHLYGQMADMNSFLSLADQHNLFVVEDAAQAIGAEYQGKRAGSMGDLGCFSFFPSKNLGAYGDGGIVTTNDAEMAEKLSTLRLHGANPKYHHSMVGINSRLDALQASVLSVKLKYLEAWSRQRRNKALNYNRLFNEAGIALERNGQNENDDDANLGKKIILPAEVEGSPKNNGRHIYHQYVIQTKNRSQIIEALDENNIGHSIYYPVPLHEQKCFAYLGYEEGDCPVSHQASQTTLALPVYPELDDAEQEYIVQTIKDTLNS